MSFSTVISIPGTKMDDVYICTCTYTNMNEYLLTFYFSK